MSCLGSVLSAFLAAYRNRLLGVTLLGTYIVTLEPLITTCYVCILSFTLDITLVFTYFLLFRNYSLFLRAFYKLLMIFYDLLMILVLVIYILLSVIIVYSCLYCIHIFFYHG